MIIHAGMGVSSSAHSESRDLRAVNDRINQLLSLLDSEFCTGTSPPKKVKNFMTSANNQKNRQRPNSKCAKMLFEMLLQMLLEKK